MITGIIISISIYAAAITAIAYNAIRSNRELKQELDLLKIEKGKLSNSIRKKGIEVSGLTKEIDKLRKEYE